jgi:plastocyanin
MNRSLALALACCMPALLSACGSSSKGTGTTLGKAGTSATTTGARAGSSAVGSSASKRSGKSAPSGSTGLKVDTTPKFASPSSSAPVQSGVVQSAYRNIAIDPDTVRVKLGSTIKWTNYDSAEANVTSEGGPLKFASKNFGEGGTFELKASKAGVIHYECTLYPVTMNGTIEVVS